MRREEQISEASKIYSEYEYNQTDFENGFINGAKWADKNPNLDSLWHTPDDPPEPKKRLIIHCDEKMEWYPINNTILYKDSEYPWKEIVELYNILHWAYATDLVPNFNEEL